MRQAVVLAAALLAGCGRSGVAVRADVGATLTSDDGVLTLVLPPGALPSDTTISIEAIGEGDWPVDAPGRFLRPAPVYRIQPSGLELADDAYVVFVPTEPSLLATDAGEDVLAVHYSWGPSDEKVRPAARSRTLYLADGQIAVVSTVFELGVHWIGERVPGSDRTLPQLALGVDRDLPAAPTIGAPFHVGSMTLRSDMTHALFGRETFATAVTAGAVTFEPEAWVGGATSVWDATVDPERLLHPYEVFDGLPSPRRESVASLETMEPITLAPGEALAPAVDPLPGWSCRAAGRGGLFVGIDVITGASEGVARVGAVVELPVGDCR